MMGNRIGNQLTKEQSKKLVALIKLHFDRQASGDGAKFKFLVDSKHLDTKAFAKWATNFVRPEGRELSKQHIVARLYTVHAKRKGNYVGASDLHRGKRRRVVRVGNGPVESPLGLFKHTRAVIARQDAVEARLTAVEKSLADLIKELKEL